MMRSTEVDRARAAIIAPASGPFGRGRSPPSPTDAPPVKQKIPPLYRQYLRSRSEPLLESRHRLTWRGFFVGGCLSFFLAISAPYSNMVIKGAYVAADISTPGAIFVFVVLIGLLNLAFKLAARSRDLALAFALRWGLPGSTPTGP